MLIYLGVHYKEMGKILNLARKGVDLKVRGRPKADIRRYKRRCPKCARNSMQLFKNLIWRRHSVSSDFEFKQILSGENSLLDVIFVHGLTGNAKDTWESTIDNSFWPEWLQEDLKHLSIYTLAYPSSLFEKWAKKEMDIFERAKTVLEFLAGKNIGSRPIVFVTHSLGGLLTKILIRKSNESSDADYKRISESSRLVIFLATPHSGSNLANILDVLPKTSKQIKLLANETGFLEDLNEQYRVYANGRDDLTTKVYYEKHKTKGVATVVTRESADPGVAGAEPTPVDKDHINICKPADKDDIVYLGVKRHINNLLKEVVASSPGGNSLIGADYSVQSETDRRDLLQKLIDSNREHEYSIANNAQNNFARSFAKTGLFTVARDDHETLLSEVETRFVTHVFHPLICKGANEEDIRSALQNYVIDPISSKKIGESKFSQGYILNALYFLTEQCHIRWDAVK